MYMYNNKLWKNVLNVPKKYPQNVILMCNYIELAYHNDSLDPRMYKTFTVSTTEACKISFSYSDNRELFTMGYSCLSCFSSHHPYTFKACPPLFFSSFTCISTIFQMIILKKTQWYSGFLKWERSGWLTSWVVRWMTWSSSWLCSCNTITPLSNVFSLQNRAVV